MVRPRKIPVRKHHGVRDPLKQIEEREKKQKNVINNPPEKGDEQKVTHKFTEFQKLLADTKAGRKIRKKRKGEEDLPKPSQTTLKRNGKSVTTTYAKKLRPIKQFVGETDEDYLKRINRITRESLREAQYEAKYGVQVIRNPSTGEITIKTKPKNEIDELLKQKQKEHRMNKSKKNLKNVNPQPLNPADAKALIKQAIQEDNKERKKEKVLEEFKRDIVKFGETVHGPPVISVLPRRAEKTDSVPRPGKKDNLLLKSLLNAGVEKSTPTSVKMRNSKSQLLGKRKNLPEGTRRMLETEQTNIIELYRNLKKKHTTKVQLKS